MQVECAIARDVTVDELRHGIPGQKRISDRESEFQIFSVAFISCHFGKVGKVPCFVVFEAFFTLPNWPSESPRAGR